jgi:electron transfer flavoprotein alpha subunit
MAENKGVLVFGEAVEGRLAAITTELLGCARKLADELGEETSAVLVGSGVGTLAKEAIAFGADKVYVVDDPLLKDYQTDSYVAVMEKVAKQAMPSILLLGQTSTGRDLAPRLAFRLGAGLTMDCIQLGINPETKKLEQIHPVYGGNARAVFTSEAALPQIASVRLKAMSPLERDDSRQGEVISIEAGIDPSTLKARVLEKVKEEVVGVKLEDAEVVVSGGRGIGGEEGFKQLEELAKVRATRPPCDSGWVPSTWQVGLTGKIVTPDFYLAVALSGSSQHMAGCSGAKNIVAINKDPEANIFKEAAYGIVADYKQALPALTKKIQELLSE